MMGQERQLRPRSPWRRRFLITAGVLGGALAVGVWRFYRERDRLTPPAALRAGPGPAVLTAWIKIAPDSRVTVEVPRQEMGQGVTTSLPMLVAEELDADLAKVGFEEAPVDSVYANASVLGDGAPFRPDDAGWLAAIARVTQFKFGQALGVMATGGSTSVRDAWEPMRRAGATARAMLVQAAAAKLGLPTSECTVSKGIITHAASGQRVSFGEVALAAAKLPIPSDVPLKQPAAFSVLGKPQPRLDIPAKVDGTAQFGIDTRLPNLLYAAIRQCPVFGGSLKSFDAGKARTRRGVNAVLALPATSTSAAAVVAVADHYWQADSALGEVAIQWDDGPNSAHDTRGQRERYQSLLESGDARTYDVAGDVDAALASAARRLEARYFAPYLAHATMEPINCTAIVRGGTSCEVWVGNQSPSLVRGYAAKAAGLDSADVRVHTPFLGGGFGRRAEMDVVMQAVMVAKQVPDVPVQLIWSREQDIQHDVYRPMAMAKFRAALDAAGNITAWHNRIVGQSCTGSFLSRLLPALASDAMKDKTTVEGAFDLPYALPNRKVEHVLTHEPVPVGYWRSVGHSYNAFFAECFVDECAAAAGQEPYAFRKALLADRPRHRAVLETAARRSGWGNPLPKGVGRGMALAQSFHSIVAQVAEVEVRNDMPVVTRVVCAVDCGFAVNPDTVVAQMQSGIVFGLSAALFGEITVKNGRIEQSNFPSYDMVRLAQSPHIEVHIVDSGIEHLGGIGEPGTPPIAPAVCNALFAATGKRIRELPIRL
ncbi:MAG TPA: xanthine dehydrogenase family protein molybdopterin-binding subunit [Burkholderiales bacterium]|nr:xanthine dehydrogenase family protein molybdopterin-binding subunit [Burkholderiales bacterium]